MENIFWVARRVRECFESRGFVSVFPLFEMFPCHCCEHSSMLFGYYLSLAFPEKEIMLIRGCHRGRYDKEYHFWLEVDGNIFDLTLDQFEGYSSPLFSASYHPLKEYFEEDVRTPVLEHFSHYISKVVNIECFVNSLNFLSKN
ncbi:hypothetical protein [Oceanimonas smirnovii]|uniref:hypothetical protein n=1 Tax=Oceanimonas smirnovii TaxID=264574 RepID=UPI003FD227BA